jgi:hypothetical protein
LKQALEQKEPPAAATKGTIADLQDGNRKVVLKLADGKTFEASVSGSRTEITVGGNKSDRNALKTGMNCSVQAPSSGAEAKTIACN